jgi:hypothetical protein
MANFRFDVTQKTRRLINGLAGGVCTVEKKSGKSALTSPLARPTLQSQTGFVGCEAVESDSPIKRKPACAGSWKQEGKMLIRQRMSIFFLSRKFAPHRRPANFPVVMWLLGVALNRLSTVR